MSFLILIFDCMVIKLNEKLAACSLAHLYIVIGLVHTVYALN